MAKGFLKDTKAELKKVVWPTKKQIVNNTVWVLSLVAIVAVVVLFVDMALEAGDAKLWEFISNLIG
jgi:preprotein translocase subunit SecE